MTPGSATLPLPRCRLRALSTLHGTSLAPSVHSLHHTPSLFLTPPLPPPLPTAPRLPTHRHKHIERYRTAYQSRYSECPKRRKSNISNIYHRPQQAVAAAIELPAGTDWRCAVPTNPDAKTSIVWPNRYVWSDPGAELCPTPAGLDAGLCSLQDGRSVIRCLPSFVIIGVQKAATRELMNWLRLHPTLSRLDVPELHFLHSIRCKAGSGKEDATDLQCSYGRDGVGPVRRKFELSEPEGFWRNYGRLFPTSPPNATADPEQQFNVGVYHFEKTPSYIAMPVSKIKMLRKTFPSMRFITLLRNPVERAYSWFRMKCLVDGNQTIGAGAGIVEVLAGERKGRLLYLNTRNMKALGLTKALKARRASGQKVTGFGLLDDFPNLRRPACSPEDFHTMFTAPGGEELVDKNDTGGAWEAMARGIYINQLRKWWSVYPASQIKLVTTDVLLTRSRDAMADIEKFLGIPPYRWEAHFRITDRNTTTIIDRTTKADWHALPKPILEKTSALLREFYRESIAELNKVIPVDSWR